MQWFKGLAVLAATIALTRELISADWRGSGMKSTMRLPAALALQS